MLCYDLKQTSVRVTKIGKTNKDICRTDLRLPSWWLKDGEFS